MIRHIIQRLLLLFVILAGVCTVTFFLSRVLPGSPVELMLGHRPTAEQITKAKTELGLDQPLAIQYVTYLGEIFRGEFGMSLRTKQPVLTEITNRIGATFELTTLAILLVLVLGIPLGVLSAIRQNSMLDNIVRAGAVGGVAIPAFMLAMVLQLVFYGVLGWLPLQGRLDAITSIDSPIAPITRLFLVDSLLTGNWDAFVSALSHIILPALTLTVTTLASVTRITRNMMVEVLKEEYIRTAFAYGLPKRSIYFRHALKATLIPMLTVVGLTYGYLIGGAVIVEFVFDWPGLGGFLVFSITQNDFPAMVGTTLVLAFIYLMINLIVDLLYFVIDPRLKPS